MTLLHNNNGKHGWQVEFIKIQYVRQLPLQYVRQFLYCLSHVWFTVFKSRLIYSFQLVLQIVTGNPHLAFVSNCKLKFECMLAYRLTTFGYATQGKLDTAPKFAEYKLTYKNDIKFRLPVKTGAWKQWVLESQWFADVLPDFWCGSCSQSHKRHL